MNAMLPGILGGVSALKAIGDKRNEEQDRLLAAQSALNSPWSQIAAQQALKIPQRAPGMIGAGVAGAVEGYSQQAAMEKAAKEGALLDAKTNAYKNNPYMALMMER